MIIFSSCLVTSQIVQVNDGNQDIPLYSDNTIVEKAYTEIIYMELTGSIFTSRKKMKSKLIEKAKENGIKEISLGETRLRTETAGIFACVTYANLL